MADQQPTPPPRPGGRRRALRWSPAAVAFVVGLVVGAVVVGIVAGRPTEVPAAAGAAPSAAPTTGGTRSAPPSAAATAQVVVNDACLHAINAAQDVYQQLGDLADAAQHLDAARLDEVIRALQPLQQRLRTSVPDCQVTTRLPDGSVISGTPTATSSAAPTS